MKFRIIIQPPARLDVESAYLYLREHAPKAAAERWLATMEKAMLSLEQMPARCGLAPESREFPEPIRQLIVVRRRNAYRVLFVIRGKTVRVLHVRHGARRPMSGGEIEG
jgi:plasmid stabilization system protein ParE